jgi:hypothetical protein
MTERPYELVHSPAGTVARVRIRGSSILSSPLLRSGTAFTAEERQALGLTGLLPHGVSTIEHQLRRTYTQFGRQVDDLGKNVYLANLRDRNEVLFYRLLTEHLEEMLPADTIIPVTGSLSKQETLALPINTFALLITYSIASMGQNALRRRSAIGRVLGVLVDAL